MKNIYKALAAFQQSCPVIHKDTSGYGYTYADLPKIYSVIMPLLKENGLGFTQILKDRGIETTLFHVDSGETITGYAEVPTDIELAKMNAYQVMGSAYTYFRRYALSSMLGIVTDKDNDAAGEQVPTQLTKKVISDDVSNVFEQVDKGIDTLDETQLRGALEKLNTTPNPKLTKEEVKKLIYKIEVKLGIDPELHF